MHSVRIFTKPLSSPPHCAWAWGLLLLVLLIPLPVRASTDGAAEGAAAIPAHMRCIRRSDGSARATVFAPRTSRAVELTFLKSRPGQRANLVRYIVANWFAMDAVARAKGLLDGFSVVESGDDDGSWNVMVSTTYRDTRGHENAEQAFEPIRKRHKEVLVDGRTLDDLGSIVESHTVFEHPGHTSC
jgi:hypothetical protein